MPPAGSRPPTDRRAAAADATGVADRRQWRVDAAALAIVAVLLRVPALLASRHLTFDDGQYGVVVLGLRAGDLPFRDLFSSQGPLYYPLLAVADLVGLRTLDGPRLLPVAAGAVAVVATYAIARHLGSRAAALVAAVLVATSGSMLYVTGPLSGDGPALALALTAVALAFRFRAHPSRTGAIAVGVAMGAAVCVKLIVVPAALPIGLLLLGIEPGRLRPARDRLGALAAAVGAAVVVLIAAVAPWGPQRVWDQSVAYHQDSERLRGYGGNLWTLVRTLAERDPFLLAAVILGVGALGWRSRRGRAAGAVGPGRSDEPGGSLGTAKAPAVGAPVAGSLVAVWLVGGWLGLQVAFLVIEPTMWRPHIAQLIAPLALTTVLLPFRSWRVLAVVALALAPWWYANTHDIVWPDDYGPGEATLVARLRDLPPDALVISDDPGFAWRAERRVPANFVDVSKKRFQQRQITLPVVRRAASARSVCAVLVFSPERLGSLRGLPDALTRAGYEVTFRIEGPPERVLYERPDCAPPSA